MVSRKVFTIFVIALGLQRLLEMRLSRRNERIIRGRGGHEVAPQQLGWMKLLHSSWLIAMPLEVYVRQRPFQLALAIPAALFFTTGQALRYTAIRALGRRWTVRVMIVPGEAPIRSGIYRYLRHPNYLGVAIEIAAAPLMHGATWTSIVFSSLNALILAKRIRVENRALVESEMGPEVITKGEIFSEQLDSSYERISIS